jgi:hypothetical protein
MARLQAANHHLAEQLRAAGGMPPPAAGATAATEGVPRLPALAAGRQHEGSAQQGVVRPGRPGRAPSNQSLAQAHAHKARRAGGGSAAGGWAEWNGDGRGRAEPHRRPMHPVPSASRLPAGAVHEDAAAAWSEGDVAARMEELVASSPRSHQKSAPSF